MSEEWARAGGSRLKARSARDRAAASRSSPYAAELAAARNRRLRIAVTTNNAELTERLLDAGGDPDHSDEHKRSLLHVASCCGYVDVVRALLERGADPNARDSLGNTPLHLVACTSHAPVVVELLRAGTDVSSRNRHGRNPVQLAQSKLKVIRMRPHADTDRLKGEIRAVVDVMLEYLHNQKLAADDVEACALRLENLSTTEQIEDEVKLLLRNLDDLDLSQ